MTACWYAGLNEKVAAGSLVRTRIASGAEPVSFVDFLDGPALKVVDPHGIYSCPVDRGGEDLLIFEYPSGPTVDISVPTSGCMFATNGKRTVWGSPITELLSRWPSRSAGSTGPGTAGRQEPSFTRSSSL